MRKNKLIILTTLLFAIVVTSCNQEYRGMVKKAKSRTIADKDTAAKWFYNNKKYDRALPLLEELVPLYSGLEEQQEVYYYYCYSHFFLGQMISAQFYFDDFATKFPTNEHADECEYMSAKCFYLLSDPYYLDQSYTDKALEAIQLYLSRHPKSDYAPEADKMLLDLRERKAQKAFEQASLYYNIGYYKSAVEAFQLMIKEFPDSKYREEAQYFLIKSAYSLAEASIDSRKIPRYKETIKFKDKFVGKFPNSEYSGELESLGDNANRSIVKLEEEYKALKEEQLFDKIKEDLQAVMRSNDEEQRSEVYNTALENYDKFRNDYPSSRRLEDIDKLFKKVDNLQDSDN